MRVKLPKEGEAIKVALRLSPSTSVSLSNTELFPVLVSETVPPNATSAASFTPTGASFVGLIVMVTVTVLPSDVPSFDL